MDANTSPLRLEDTTPGSARVCVCGCLLPCVCGCTRQSRRCPGCVGRAGLPCVCSCTQSSGRRPGGVQQAGPPGAFWCASPFLLPFSFFRPPPGCVSPCSVCVFFLLFCAPLGSVFLMFPALGALGLGALWLLPSSFFFSPRPLSPLFRCLRPWVPWASGLCGCRPAPFFLFLFFHVVWCPAVACCFVRCFIVYGAVVRCCVLWCLFGNLPYPGALCSLFVWYAVSCCLFWLCRVVLTCPPPAAALVVRPVAAALFLVVARCCALSWGAVPCCSAVPPLLRCAVVCVVSCCLVLNCFVCAGWCRPCVLIWIRYCTQWFLPF